MRGLVATLLPGPVRWLAPLACLVGVLASSAGCGPAGPGKLLPVEGTVTIDGKPLTTGTVSFRPATDKGNTGTAEPAGASHADGRYQVFTAGRPGAPPVWYRILLVADQPDANNPSAAPKSLVPVKYREAKNSQLLREVVERPAAGAYDLKLAR